jgi:SAM-dependent methyltransferase
MNRDKTSPSLAGFKGADQIAEMPGLSMQTEEAHLGGYVLDGAAPGTWCPGVWDWAVNELGVNSVLEIGCGLGYATKYFHDHGCRVLGVDGSPTAIRDSVIQQYVDQHDFCDAPYLPDGEFDLIWTAEFVEHVAEKYSGNFLVSFCSALKFIMLTYAAPGQGGHHHVNEQPEDYWVRRLGCIGFELGIDLTTTSRRLVADHAIVGKHFRNRGLVFRRMN